ncbi:MAG: phosphatidate cytidylyltransferase [Christensenellaceae bacterium]|nr:phosphatidate cytidylyltransferase [Christensenellaceae bacterium]
MKQRVLTGALLSLTALVLLWIGGAVLGVAATAMMCVGLWEEFRALTQAGHRPVAWPTWAAVVLCAPLALLCGAKTVLPLVFGVCLLTLACVIFGREAKLEDAVMSLLPLFTVFLPGLCAISIIRTEPRQLQWTLLTLLVAVPCIGDIFAMQIGKRIGGPKLCPVVSPNKTISGAVGGLCGSVIAAVLVGIAAALLCRSQARMLLPSWWEYLLLGLIGGAASQLGDLCFSLIKRYSGIKDYSNLFPGHGGMLDRLDSILFMALVIYSYYLLACL